MNSLFGRLRASALLLLVFFTACDPSKRINKDYLLFQHDRDDIVKVQLKELTIKPNDMLNIQVYSRTLNQEQAALYNITGQTYLVGVNGRITMPMLGEVAAAGLTRAQLSDFLESKLTAYVKDPSVSVRFHQFTITVLGDVNGPGTKTFNTDKVTIIDAIGASGDLAPTGRRENVLVSREDNNGFRRLYEIDLRSAAFFNSPVYQLQQNDIVYVNANRAKLRSLRERPEDPMRYVNIAFGLFGVVSSILLLIRR